MMDLLEQNISGLTAKLTDLRNRKDNFLKAAGIQEEEAMARVKIQELTTEIQTEVEALKALNQQKGAVVAGVSSKISETMSLILPYGKAVFRIEDDALFVGWDIPGRGVVPWDGLSGGQSVAFRPALGYALSGTGDKIVIIEAAEMDPDTLDKLLAHLPVNLPGNCQAIVNTCHTPELVPAEWQTTVL